MDNMRKAFDASEFLAQLGVEDKLNEFLDSEAVKARILPKYEAVKANLTEAVGRLPENYREKAANRIEEMLQNMDEEVFVESVLGKFSEDISHSMWTLSKYLDITATVEQLMQAVAEETELHVRIEEMAGELADALRRNAKVSLVNLCSEECESEEDVQNIIKTVYEGDDDAPVVIVVEGLEEVAEGLAEFLGGCIFGHQPESEGADDGQSDCEEGHHCCCGGEGHCKCKESK